MTKKEQDPVLLRAARMYVKGYEPPWPQPIDEIHKLDEFKKDPTELACAYVVKCEEVERLRKDSGRAALVQAVAAENDRIEQVLAQALGNYPRYSDDLINFPSAEPDDPSVCVGEEVPITLAMQAAREIVRLRTERNRLAVCALLSTGRDIGEVVKIMINGPEPVADFAAALVEYDWVSFNKSE